MIDGVFLISIAFSNRLLELVRICPDRQIRLSSLKTSYSKARGPDNKSLFHESLLYQGGQIKNFPWI